MKFSRNVQLATTWRIMVDIVSFHGEELEICIEQNGGETDQYSLALTERVIGYSYLRFEVASQEVEVENPMSDHDSIYVDNPRPTSELKWNPKNYVEAFLSRDPYSVVLDIEAIAGFTRDKYPPGELTRKALAVHLTAGLLHRKMLTKRRLEVANAFRQSVDDENGVVRAWAIDHVSDRVLELDWPESAKASMHLWKVGRAEDFNARETRDTPGLVFAFESGRVHAQGLSKHTFSVWDMNHSGSSYKAIVNELEQHLDSAIQVAENG